jgi:hypothetical protein
MCGDNAVTNAYNYDDSFPQAVAASRPPAQLLTHDLHQPPLSPTALPPPADAPDPPTILPFPTCDAG